MRRHMLCSRQLSAARLHVSRARAAINLCRSTAPTSSSKEGAPLDAWLAGLQLMEQQYEVAGRVLHLIAPLDIDAVMDMYIHKGIDGDPYWARVWPSAISLAQQLLQRPHLVAGKRVADLGAGLGVAGIAAALAGAREVVLLDREPLALQCGLISASASGVNGVQGLEAVQLQKCAPAGAATAGVAAAMVTPSSTDGSDDGAEGVQIGERHHALDQQQQQQVPAAELLQLTQLYLQQRLKQQEVVLQSVPDQEATKSISDTGSSNGSARQQQQLLTNHHHHHHQHQQQQQHGGRTTFSAVPFDWSSSGIQFSQQFDVVLACDVIYEASAVEPVAAVVQQLLRRSPGSLLLLADPPNRTADNRQRFIELLSVAQPGALLLEESGVYQCAVNQLDPEMVGGVKGESVAVQFMAFRSSVGHDTIGVKL